MQGYKIGEKRDEGLNKNKSMISKIFNKVKK